MRMTGWLRPFYWWLRPFFWLKLVSRVRSVSSEPSSRVLKLSTTRFNLELMCFAIISGEYVDCRWLRPFYWWLRQFFWLKSVSRVGLVSSEPSSRVLKLSTTRFNLELMCFAVISGEYVDDRWLRPFYWWLRQFFWLKSVSRARLLSSEPSSRVLKLSTTIFNLELMCFAVISGEYVDCRWLRPFYWWLRQFFWLKSVSRAGLVSSEPSSRVLKLSTTIFNLELMCFAVISGEYVDGRWLRPFYWWLRQFFWLKSVSRARLVSSEPSSGVLKLSTTIFNLELMCFAVISGEYVDDRWLRPFYWWLRQSFWLKSVSRTRLVSSEPSSRVLKLSTTIFNLELMCFAVISGEYVDDRWLRPFYWWLRQFFWLKSVTTARLVSSEPSSRVLKLSTTRFNLELMCFAVISGEYVDDRWLRPFYWWLRQFFWLKSVSRTRLVSSEPSSRVWTFHHNI